MPNKWTCINQRLVVFWLFVCLLLSLVLLSGRVSLSIVCVPHASVIIPSINVTLFSFVVVGLLDLHEHYFFFGPAPTLGARNKQVSTLQSPIQPIRLAFGFVCSFVRSLSVMSSFLPLSRYLPIHSCAFCHSIDVQRWVQQCWCHPGNGMKIKGMNIEQDRFLFFPFQNIDKVDVF